MTGEETDEPVADRYSARVWMLEKTPACTGRLHVDRGHRSSLLDEGVTVQTITHEPNDTTGHVAHATRDDAIVVVVVVGEADRSTVERVLGGVTLYGSPGRDERIPRGENRLPSG